VAGGDPGFYQRYLAAAQATLARSRQQVETYTLLLALAEQSADPAAPTKGL